MAKRKGDVQLAQRHGRLGHRRLTAGDYGRAWSHFEQALAIRQRLLATGGVDVDIQGELDRAQDCYEQALFIWKLTLGTEHAHTAAGLYNLGMLLWAEGDREQARAFCRQLNRLLNGRFPQAATFLQTY
jgi:tetratricopeptide (TPR) repeat protein